MANSSANSAQRRDAVNAALNLAIERKNMDMITLAMTNGGDAATLLTAGIAQENMDMITLALDKGADANTLLFAGIARGRPASERLGDFFRAVAEDNARPSQTSLAWVQTAIRRGADANATKKGGDGNQWSVIHWGHICFRKEIMDALVQAGAKVDAQSPEGTPLMRAIAEGSAKKIEYYLEHGADPACICGKTFPMAALEESQNFSNGKKAKLLALMMRHLPVAPAEAPAPLVSAPVEPAVSTAQDIEVSHPLALKVPPKSEGPSKTFSL